MLAFDQELASAKAESAALRRQMTADLAAAHAQAQPMQFLDNLDVSELKREIEFHRARGDDSIDARLNILLLDSSFPIIRDYARYTAEQVAEAHKHAGDAIGKLRQLMNNPPVDHLAQAQAELDRMAQRKRQREELARQTRESLAREAELLERMRQKQAARELEQSHQLPLAPIPPPQPDTEPEADLERTDDGIVAANNLDEIENDTPASGSLHVREDGIDMEIRPPIDPRDEVLAMSEADIAAVLEDMNPLEEPEMTEVEARTWLKTASLEELTSFASDQKAIRKRTKLTIKALTDEIDRRLDALLHEGNDD
jgi:hypothetical protein